MAVKLIYQDRSDFIFIIDFRLNKMFRNPVLQKSSLLFCRTFSIRFCDVKSRN